MPIFVSKTAVAGLAFGAGEDSIYLSRTFTVHVQILYFAHNEFFDVLVRFGLIGLFLYGKIIYNTLLVNKTNKNIMNLLLPFFASMWIMMLFESYSNYPYYFLYFVLLMYPRTLNESCDKLNNLNSYGK